MDQPEIKRPWGGYTILHITDCLWIKKLFLDSGLRTSLQRHDLRDEIWFVLQGNIIAQIGEKYHEGKSGDIFFIPKLKKHRLTAVDNTLVLEIAHGTMLETDILRFEDDYGRVTV